MAKKSLLKVSEGVAWAIGERQPVVAVDTASLYHQEAGVDNLKAAQQCMEAVRKNGAVPAVVAILDGALRVGLDDEELKQFLSFPSAVKCNMRDIAAAVISGCTGITTLSATMHAARLAGIAVVAGGGMGGVHRGAGETMDISPDLQQLARSRVAVVCSGAKPILNLPLTMEYLETHGVTVMGYRTRELPAFYLRSCGIPLEYRFDEPEEVARLIRAKELLDDPSGVLVANPVDESCALDPAVVNFALEHALEDARQQGVRGKAITGFLMDAISAAAPEKAAIAAERIRLDNAALAARIAVALRAG